MRQGKRNGKRLCTLAAALVLGIHASAVAQAPELLEPVGVMLDTVEAYVGEVSRIDVYNGSVVPHMEELYFAVEGVVEQMHVIVGQEVKAGDVLIVLNQEAEMERAEAIREEMEELQKNGEYEEQLWEIDLKIIDTEIRALNAMTPHDETAVELKKLEREEMQLNMTLEKSLRSLQLKRLQTELEELEEEMARNTMTAPFDGCVVYASALQRGDYVSAYTPLLYLADESRLSVKSEYISSTYLIACRDLYAHIGDKRYEITPLPIDDEEYIAQVLAGEELSTYFEVEADEGELHAGEFAAVCLMTQRVENALIVPTNAVFTDASGKYLYVIEDGVRVRRDVKIGVTTDWETQILDGLEEGAVVYVKD